MKSIGFRLQEIERSSVALSALDSLECAHNGPAGAAQLNHSGHDGRLLAQRCFYLIWKLYLIKLLSQAAVIVLIALSYATTVEPL